MIPTFIPRNIHEPGGMGYILRQSKGLPPIDVPRDVAGWQVDHKGRVPVTWAEIHARRTGEQLDRLKAKRRPSQTWPQPAQLWVFDNGDQFPFGGWWCYIRHRGPWGRIECLRTAAIKGDVTASSDLAQHLRRIIPLVLPTEPWSEWMRAFAKACPKRRSPRDPRAAGILNGWTDGHLFHHTRAEAVAAIDTTASA